LDTLARTHAGGDDDACVRGGNVKPFVQSLATDKLSKAAFNTQLFVKELAAAYDLAIIKSSKKKRIADDAPIYAQDLYDVLTPMKRYKKDYTKHNFAYDLSRLCAEEGVTLDDGRMLRFDTVRDTKKAIRILDRHGAEQFITTIWII